MKEKIIESAIRRQQNKVSTLGFYSESELYDIRLKFKRELDKLGN